MPHRPVEPGIGARLRRPDAFDQPAQHQAVDGLQARFEQAEDAHPRVRPPAGAPAGPRSRRETARNNRRARSQAAPALAISSNASSRIVVRDLEAVEHLRVTFRDLGERQRLGRQRFQRRQRAPELVDQRLRGSRARRRGFRRADRNGAAPRIPCARAWRAHCGASRARAARPSVPGFGRVPRSTARSSAATACAIEPAERMLQQRQQRHRREPAAAPPRPPAARTRPPAYSASVSPAESSTGTSQRASAASTRRASARSGVTSAAVLPGSSIASRSATAIASASSSALAASIVAMVASAASAWVANAGSASRSCQRSVAAAGRSASESEPLAPVRRGLRERASPRRA